jgi:hypothetical protein
MSGPQENFEGVKRRYNYQYRAPRQMCCWAEPQVCDPQMPLRSENSALVLGVQSVALPARGTSNAADI